MTKMKRILVIDDSEVMLERINNALVQAGYEVVTTTHIVGNARYLLTCDLVIIDFHMPGLDGSSVVSSLRSIANSSKNICPLIVYTADEKIAAMHAQLGFDGAFTAKGDARALVRQVATLFRTMHMRIEKERRSTEEATRQAKGGS
jgi:two-component system, OmpR family, response regulator